MKQSIKSVGGVYNTGRMIVDYLNKLYIPQIEKITSPMYEKNKIEEYISWEKDIREKWSNIKITPTNNLEELVAKAGNTLNLSCNVNLGNIDTENIVVEVYVGKMDASGKMVESYYKEMSKSKDLGNNEYEYSAEIVINNGGNYGYTFRVMPTNEMLLDSENLDLVKWITK